MYTLNREWTLFYHAKDKNKSYDQNTIKLIDITTVEDFWKTLNNIPKPVDIFNDGSKYTKILKINGEQYLSNAYSFFQKGVIPTWDDPSNVNGAEWSIRRFNGLGDISNMWVTSLVDLISEHFEYSEHIKGIRIVDSTLPSKPMYRLEYWFDTTDVSQYVHDYIKKSLQIKMNLLYREHKHIKEA